MSVVIDSTDELRTFLSSQTYSQAITFDDSYVPRLRVEDMGSNITGTLYPATNHRERQNRGPIVTLFSINIAVSKKVDPTVSTDIDEMMTLVEEIAESLDNLATSTCRTLRVVVDPIFDFDRLREFSVFTSIVNIEARAR